MVDYEVKSVSSLHWFVSYMQVCTCTAFSTVCNEQGYPAQLVAGYSDGTLRVFDVGRLNMVQKLQPHSVPVKVVRYSTDGKYLYLFLGSCFPARA